MFIIIDAECDFQNNSFVFGTIKASLNKNSRCICKAFIRLIVKQVIFFITPRPLGYSKQNFDYVCFFFRWNKNSEQTKNILQDLLLIYIKSCEQSQGYLTTKRVLRLMTSDWRKRGFSFSYGDASTINDNQPFPSGINKHLEHFQAAFA